MKLTREEALHKIILNDIDNILCDHPERTLYDILENDCEGYKNWDNKEIEEYFIDFFDETLEILKKEKIK